MTKATTNSARVSVMICFLLLATSAVFAHGGEQHVIGIVSQITDSTITVKTVGAGDITVAIVSATEVTHAGKTAKIADLKVGDRVVIHAMKHGDELMAHTVQFAAPAAPAAKKPD